MQITAKTWGTVVEQGSAEKLHVMAEVRAPRFRPRTWPYDTATTISDTGRGIAYSQSSTMSAAPRFFKQPFRYLHWASIEKPAIFWSICIGSVGPIMVLTVPKIRARFGDPQRPQIPLTYPIPAGPRKQLSGYEDK